MNLVAAENLDPELDELVKESAKIQDLPGPALLEPVRLQLLPHKPPKCNPRPVSEPIKEFLNQTVQTLIDRDLIQACPDGHYAAPVHCVPKGDTFRLTIDYRLINAYIVPHQHPVPHIHDILSEVAKFGFFSVIDLQAAFWQLPLEEASWQYTGFTVPGHPIYVWKVMPFGLAPSGPAFQARMDRLIPPEEYHNTVFPFFDDIVIGGYSKDEVVKTTKRMLGILLRHRVRINLQKLRIGLKEVKVLGSIVRSKRILPNPEKIQGLVQAPAPCNRKELETFLGAAGYWRNHIPRYSSYMRKFAELRKDRAGIGANYMTRHMRR